jgi:lipid II isoglutaminyl synthase (glutamine-hydrolysing)
MTARKISLGILYPHIMGAYGDRGNVDTVIRRCGWRGIAVEVLEVRLGDALDPDAVDLVMIGSGGEAQQRLIADDLYKVKGAAIREAVARGAAALAVGGGYELFGRFCQLGQGSELPGISLFDAWTIRPRGVVGDHYDTITETLADRAIGELVVRWRDTLLVGFENHSGGTYLGPTAQPLGQVICGHGNNGDGTEGVMLGNAVGTYLRGPCLPKNPVLADFLIAEALLRRYGVADLLPLPDDLEEAAHNVALERAHLAAAPQRRETRLGLPRAVLSRSSRRRLTVRLGPEPLRRAGNGPNVAAPPQQTPPTEVADDSAQLAESQPGASL